jgi:hypothetical protein
MERNDNKERNGKEWRSQIIRRYSRTEDIKNKSPMEKMGTKEIENKDSKIGCRME